MSDFEKLGAFYLGRPHDLATRTTGDTPLLYDSRDLVTHAACIGMTGSGKTGLCVGLIEEALLDGIPALVIDPKGDLSNLLLTFPDLSPDDFRPWVNDDDARRAGESVEAFAAGEAAKWQTGLARWGQDGARIRALRAAGEMAIYTPGSTAGLPVNVLASFKAPAPDVLDDSELLRERLVTTTSGLLGLVGVDADPLQSREHILVATLLEAAWRDGRDLDLVGLIQAIQTPPLTRIGALDLEAFYPSKDRFSLAMTLNNLLAAPGFDVWMQGDPLDVGRLLRTADGRPRVAIMSIAHLNDAERMFFVTLLLNEVIGWMRTQSGTTSLRALVYMDEVAGYLPPVASPPSKAPILLLLKQARAFGVGLVLATQNPVDLDYKALGNIGTWFIGRLQTERDKARLLDGLQGTSAAAGMDRAALDATLSALGNRVFLMHNVHEDQPVTFETRWVLSYLRGPLTRTQIRQLMDRARPSAPTAPPAAAVPTAPTPAGATVAASAQAATGDPSAPILPPGIRQHFLPLREAVPAGAPILYTPALYAAATLHFVDARRQVDETTTVQRIARLRDGAVTVDWSDAEATDVVAADVDVAPLPGARFARLPTAATAPKQYDTWKRALATSLYATQTLDLLVHAATGLHQRPGETEGAFRVRVQERQHEARDADIEKLRAKFASRIATQQDRVRRAAQAIAREQGEVTQTGLQTVVTTITGLAGALFGRKLGSATNMGRLGTAARGAGRTVKAQQDVARARETHAAETAKLDALQTELDDALHAVQARYADVVELTTVSLRPRKSDITVDLLTLAWVPQAADA
jgi:hypothetical protein